MKIRTLLLLAIIVVLAPLAAAGALGVKEKKLDVKFIAKGTGGLTFDGKVKKMAVTESAGNLLFTVLPKDIDTGIGLRNKHMRGFLEADKYPEITLQVPRAEVKTPEDGKKVEGTVRGWLTAHGVRKPAVIAYEMEKNGSSWKIDSRFEVDIREHGIKVPSYLGVTVEPVMPVEADLEVTE